MTGVQDAVKNAMASAIETPGASRCEKVRLEEVDSTSVSFQKRREEAWLITLSIPLRESTSDQVALAIGQARLEYKTFTVLKRSGEVISMRIRDLERV